MKIHSLAVALLTAGLIVACGVPVTEPTPMIATPTEEPVLVITATPEETATEAPVVATNTPPPTPTLEPQYVWGPNLFQNPSFEGLYQQRPVIWNLLTRETMTPPSNFYPEHWSAVWADWQFAGYATPDGRWLTPNVPAPNICPEGQTSACNPVTLNGQPSYMGTPEFGDVKIWDYPTRVRTGDRAARWFLYYRTGIGGFCQSVHALPGKTEVGAYVQSWSSHTLNNGKTDDIFDGNSEWFIMLDFTASNRLPINPQTRTRIGDNGQQYVTPNLGSSYDKYHAISLQFDVLRESDISVCFINFRNWPKQFNESWMDDAYFIQQTRVQ